MIKAIDGTVNEGYPQFYYQSFDTTGLDVLAYLASHIEEKGCAPSQREMMRACYLAHSSIRYQLSKLREHGFIIYQRGVARGLHVADKPTAVLPARAAARSRSRRPRKQSPRRR